MPVGYSNKSISQFGIALRITVGVSSQKNGVAQKSLCQICQKRLENRAFFPYLAGIENSYPKILGRYFLFPIALLKRLSERIAPPRNGRSDLAMETGPFSKLLCAILSAEAPLVAGMGLPFGLSVIAVGVKR